MTTQRTSQQMKAILHRLGEDRFMDEEEWTHGAFTVEDIISTLRYWKGEQLNSIQHLGYEYTGSASKSSVYRTLATMEERGMVVKLKHEAHGKPYHSYHLPEKLEADKIMLAEIWKKVEGNAYYNGNYVPDSRRDRIELLESQLSSQEAWYKNQLEEKERKYQELYTYSQRQGYSGFNNTTAIPPDIMKKMRQLCHPDKHQGKQSANDVTTWLNSQNR